MSRFVLFLVAAVGCTPMGAKQSVVSPDTHPEESGAEAEEAQVDPSGKQQGAAEVASPDCQVGEPESPSNSVSVPKEAWQWDCPDSRAKAVEHTPVSIVEDLAVLYPMFVNDYLDGYGQWGGAIREHIPSARRKILCAWLTGSAADALGKAQEGVVPEGPEECVGEDSVKASQGRFEYEFRRLQGGRYVVGRVANNTKSIDENDGYKMRISIERGLVVAEISQRAYRCELDPQDPCRYFDPEDGKGARSLCFDDKTSCVSAEFSTSVYVTDAASGASADFGLFHRRTRPDVLIGEGEVTVVSDDCRQTAKLPLAKPCTNEH